MVINMIYFFFFSSRRRHTRSLCDWSSDVCSSDLITILKNSNFKESFSGLVMNYLLKENLNGEMLYASITNSLMAFREIGRASCRESVYISVLRVSLI